MITMEQIEDLAADYWKKTGKAPTHLFLTTEQQNDLSDQLRPKLRYGLGTPETNNAAVVTVNFTACTLDIIPLVPLRVGTTHNLKAPSVTRIEQE